MTASLRIGLRALGREWRAGELRIMALALILAAAGMGAVGLFTDRVERALERQAGEALAADLVVESSEPLPDSWEQRARERGLAVARTLTTVTMLPAAEGPPKLARLKAVDPAYPLRGEIAIAEEPWAREQVVAGGPPAGVVWLESGLTNRLGYSVGDTLRVGEAVLTLGAILVREPDAPVGPSGFAPRLLMNRADLAATGLITEGSRAERRLLVAGDRAAVDDFRAWLEPRLASGQEVTTPREAQPALDDALEQAQRYLALAALLAAALGGVAVALVARRYAERHRDTAAILRAIGASSRLVGRAFAWQLGLLGVVAALAGMGLAWAAQAGLAVLAADLLAVELPAPSPWPAAAAALAAAGLLVAFGLPPLSRLAKVPPARVLQRDLEPPPVASWILWGLPAVALVAVVGQAAGEPGLALALLGGLLAAVALLAAAGYGLLAFLARVGRGRGSAWRYGLANLVRRPGTSVTQVVGLGTGIAALLILTLVRTDLLESWQASLPEDAPDHFLINIPPAEVPALRAFLREGGVAEPDLHPMVRGRLTAINGAELEPAEYEEPRARRLAEREWNLSQAAEPGAGNRVVEGEWWSAPRVASGPWVSLESGIAEALGIRVGDRLSYRIGGRELELLVTNLREVDWDSFRANFFAVTPPGALADYPATWITSFRLPDGDERLLTQLNRQFPAITILDTGRILEQVRSITERVALAVEYVFGFTLIAGVLLLYAALESTLDERRREGAILRALGAGRGLLTRATLAEFATLGATAGLVAGLTASGLGMALAVFAFDLPWQPAPEVILIGVVAGAGGAALTGWLGARGVVREPPLAVLRRTGE